MKILITGGRGFIGTNLIHSLIILNKFDIYCVDKISYSSVPLSLLPYDINKIKFIKLNLSNRQKTKELIAQIRPDIIVNLAAETHVDRSLDNPIKFINNNNDIIMNLLESCRNKKFLKKFINISTDEIYGGNNLVPAKENNRFDTSSPYSASKAFGNLLANAYKDSFNLPIINVQCCNNFGNYQFTEKLIPRSIFLIENDKSLEIYADGKNIREWIYVKDFCNAILKIINFGKIGNSYNVGTGRRLTNNQLVDIVINEHSKITNKPLNSYIIKYVTDRPGHDFKYALNSKKIQNELNWYPNTSLQESINLTIRWYLENKSWIKYCSKKYSGARLGLKIK
jgi:dTDP-glucose 4,6-dehydratase